MGVCGEAAILQLLHLGNENGENDEYDNCQFTWSPGVCCTVWSPWVTVQCREEAGTLGESSVCSQGWRGEELPPGGLAGQVDLLASPHSGTARYCHTLRGN